MSVHSSYVLDSSVLVSSLVPSDKYHETAARLAERIIAGSEVVYASAILPIEVCAAVARRTRDEIAAAKTNEQLKKWIELDLLRILYLNAERMRKAQDLAIKFYLKGVDANMVQVAAEKSIPLLTFDRSIAERIGPEIKTITQDSVRSELRF